MTKISATQRKNLNKLANYLLSLPEDYEHFNMLAFCKIDSGDYWGDVSVNIDSEEIKGKFPCGTVACAVGHAPNAGIKNKAGFADWLSYSSEYLLDWESPEWDWCFSDNSHYGAAKRIKYLLNYGLPEEFDNEDEDTYNYLDVSNWESQK